MCDIKIEKLFAVGAHFGHLTKFANRQMLPYIYGTVSNMSIIDLRETVSCFKKAITFIRKIVSNGGVILFVGTKRSAKAAIEKTAILCGMPYVNTRWSGGLLTNFSVVKQSVDCLQELKKMNDSPHIEFMTRVDRTILTRRLKRLAVNFNGILDMNNLPDALFVVDVKCEKAVIKEARLLKIPVIGIVDTDSCPDGVDFIIPSNDDSLGTVGLLTTYISTEILACKSNV